jgi:hypothetical protein
MYRAATLDDLEAAVRVSLEERFRLGADHVVAVGSFGVEIL